MRLQSIADDTTVPGLSTDNNKSAYRKEIEELAAWCNDLNLAPNIQKTKNIIVDYCKSEQLNHPPLYIGNEAVERVTSFKFLGLTVTEDPSSGINTTSAIGKAQQRLFYLRNLKRAKLPQRLMVNFYHCAIGSC